MTPAEHLQIETEGATSPAQLPPVEAVDPITASGWERDRQQRHAHWIRGLKDKSCQKAAEDVGALGNALLIWIDPNGELRAQRISREHSVVREFVPAYLRRDR
jgi:hypothetical protein